MESLPYDVIQGTLNQSTYDSKIYQVYKDDPEDWKRVIGEKLLFQFGVYDNDSNSSNSLDEAGLRYFESQLNLAGLSDPANHPSPTRILDIGCGWGYILKYLAERYPSCQCLDGINLSKQQLEYCNKLHRKHGLSERINLYWSNAQNLNLLPQPERLYDLAIIRGTISHFPDEVFIKTMEELRNRLNMRGTVIISDSFYKSPLHEYISHEKDDVDRLACKHRKSPESFVKVLTDCGFQIKDMQILPSNSDTIRWLMECKTNIETQFINKGVQMPEIFEEFRACATNYSVALSRNQASTYSIISKRAN